MSDSLQTKARSQFGVHGAITSRDLAQNLGVSQSTMSRVLGEMEGLLKIGRGRTTIYALSEPLPNLGSDWPLFLIDGEGDVEQIAQIHTLYGGKRWLEQSSPQKWATLFQGEFSEGIYPNSPWFLEDARPQGFLGRAFGKAHHKELKANTDPSRWSANTTMEAMIRFGGALPGAFVVGTDALRQAMAADMDNELDEHQREANYPNLAGLALGGAIIGSSAGGEQPKFPAVLLGTSGKRHVMVKFSPPMELSEGRRWADLLVAEKVAGDVLRDGGFDVPNTDIVDAGGRRFLETERFDRVGERGRLPVVSLRSLDAAFYGEMDGWPAIANNLRSNDWITEEDSESLNSLWEFGSLIANSDMHAANASLFLTPNKPLRLAPVYDMLPMAYRPGIENSLPEFTVPFPVESPDSTGHSSRQMALEFWVRMAEHSCASGNFKSIALQHAEAVKRLPVS